MTLDKEPQTAHECCWHRTGLVLDSYPPQIEEFCCWCGTLRYRTERTPPPPGEHGPFKRAWSSLRPGIRGGV